MKHIKTYEVRETYNEREEFIKYLLDFYQDVEWFKGLFTRKTVEKYVDAYITKRKKLNVWGAGDSFDREYFRDVMLIKLDLWYDTEYNVDPYLTPKEREHVKIMKATQKYNL